MRFSLSSTKKKSLTANEYNIARTAIVNNHKGILIEDFAVYVISDASVDNTKILCYDREDDYDFEITEVFMIENYNYTVNDKIENPAVVLAKGVKNGYSVEELEKILRNSNIDDGQVFKIYSNESGRFVEFKEFIERSKSARRREFERKYIFGETSEIRDDIKFSISPAQDAEYIASQ